MRDLDWSQSQIFLVYIGLTTIVMHCTKEYWQRLLNEREVMFSLIHYLLVARTFYQTKQTDLLSPRRS